MSGQLGELVVSLSADIARFQSDMGKASRIASEHADKISKSFDSLKNVASVISTSFITASAALAGGTMFGATIAKTQEVIGEVKRLKEAFGISAESASALRVALDDSFVSADTVTAASARLSKQLASGSDAFKKLGVSTKDSSGNLRPMLELITDVNSRLLDFKEGTDRNVEAQKIYGKGWEELRSVLKFTNESMAAGVERAKELGLVFSGDALKGMKDYKSAMKDLDDVAESVKVQIGMALIPELTRMATVMGNSATSGIPDFISGLHSVEAEITRLAMLADKAGGSMTAMMHYATGGDLTDTGKYWRKKNEEFEQYYNDNDKRLQTLANLEVGLDAEGNRIVSGKDDGSGGGANKPSLGGNTRESDFNAANAKYLEYLKAFEEKKAALIKAGTAVELELNRDAFSWGLKGLVEYLDDEHALKMRAIDADIAARQKEFDNAKAAFGKLTPVTGQKGESRPDKDMASYNDLLKKREDAEKAYIEAKNKGDLEGIKYTRDRLAALTESQIATTKATQAVAEMNGEWDRAKQLNIDLIDLEIQKAQTQDRGKEQIVLLQRQREELEKMRNPLGALSLGLNDFASEAGKMGDNIRASVVSSFDSMTESLASFVATGKLEFSNLAQSIIHDMAKIAIQKSITGPLAQGLGDLLGSSFLTAPGNLVGGSSWINPDTGRWFVPSAHGNAFARSGLSYYSNSIVNRPTVFPFASGVGLMGEAGPEAIMPLKRLSSGNLGVETSGGGVKIIINNNSSGVQATAEVTNNGNGGKSIEVMIDEVMSRNMMKSGSLSSKALSLRGASAPMARR